MKNNCENFTSNSEDFEGVVGQGTAAYRAKPRALAGVQTTRPPRTPRKPGDCYESLRDIRRLERLTDLLRSVFGKLLIVGDLGGLVVNL